MFVILLSVLCFFLGLKGITKAGLPLIGSTNITGVPAKLIGGVCCLAGCLMIAFIFYANLTVSQNATKLIEEIDQRGISPALQIPAIFK